MVLDNLPLGVATLLAGRHLLVESRAVGQRRVPALRGAALVRHSAGPAHPDLEVGQGQRLN